MRQVLAVIAFVSVSLASTASILMLDSSRAARRDWPQYIEFLAGVAARTSRGDSIALLVPARRGTNDYEYAYYRASYVLAGREVLPVVAGERLVPENIRRARFVAMWGGHIALKRPVVWRGYRGELLGR